MVENMHLAREQFQLCIPIRKPIFKRKETKMNFSNCKRFGDVVGEC